MYRQRKVFLFTLLLVLIIVAGYILIVSNLTSQILLILIVGIVFLIIFIFNKQINQLNNKLRILNNSWKSKLTVRYKEFKNINSELEQILNTSSNGMRLLDKDFNILRVNNAFVSLAGFKDKSEINGKKCYEVFPGNGCDTENCPVVRVIKTNKPFKLDVQKEKKDGKVFPCQLSATPFLSADGKLLGVVEDIRDLSESADAEKKLILAKEHSDRANYSKTVFLANMSHDIRTPLNTLLGAGELLGESNLSDEQKSQVDMINKSGEMLLQLVTDILDISKIEAGEVKLEIGSFNFEDLTESILPILDQKIKEKKLNIVSVVDPEIPDYLFGDSSKLTQVIVNLLGNAIKFTEKGGVYFFAKLVNKTKEDAEVHISIKDTGIGISKSHQDIIFESFKQADKTISKNFGGTGLGLAICKQIVSMMKGKIWVESVEGQGSTFHCRLPFKIDPSKSRNPELNLYNINSLVICDAEISQAIAPSYLKKLKSNVNLVSSSCLLDNELLFSTNYEIIIFNLDHLSHKLDDVFSSIDKYKINSKTLLIISSDLKNKLTENSNYREFLNRVVAIEKPVRKSHFIYGVAKLLKMEIDNNLNRNKNENTKIKDELLDGDLSNEKRLNILIADDSIDNKNLLKMYLKNVNHKIDYVDDGKQAYDFYISNDGKYDLILMDMQMPIMDGYEATRKIRDWEKEKGIENKPIIALTASVLKEEINMAMNAGCTLHFTKPFKKESLLSLLKKRF